MKPILLILMIIMAIVVSGCSDPAEEVFETAKLEELQNNPEHARQLYREIIENHPESEYAGKAKKRLSELTTK